MSEISSSEELPRHTLYGDTLPEPKLQVVIDKMIEPHFKDLPPEVELNEEIEQAIPKVGEAINMFANEQLGVDVRSRLPKRSDIHVLSRDDFTAYYSKRYHTDIETARRLWGFQHRGQIVLAEDTPSSLLHSLTHEEVHNVSGDRWRVRVPDDSGGFFVANPRHGFRVRVHAGNTPSRKSTLWAVDEYVTENFTREVDLDYWPRVGILLQPSEDDYGYLKMIPAIDKEVEIVAAKHQKSKREFVHDLERGLLTSDMKALRPLLSGLGHEKAYELTHKHPYRDDIPHHVQRRMGEPSAFKSK